MGCSASKNEKDNKKSQTSNHTQRKSGSNPSNAIHITEPITYDFILRNLDPISTQRTYIFKGTSKNNNTQRLVKQYNCNNINEDDKKKLMIFSEQLLSLKHLNITSTISHYYNKNFLHLVSEYCEGGSLLTTLDKFSELPQYAMLDVFCQVVAGVQYLHSKGIIYGLSHIMFTTKSMDNIKLIDFCIPNFIKTNCCNWKQNNSIEEISFQSPETLKGQGNAKSDIWACGCLLYFFLTSHMPFQGRDVQSIKQSIQRGVVNFDGNEWSKINQQLKQLVMKMLNINPLNRPSAQEILNNSVFTSKAKLNQKLNKQMQNSMMNFKQQSQMQSAMLNYIAENMMSDLDKKKLMEEFQKFDLNKDGQLTKDELIQVYSQILPNQQATEEVDKLFQKIDQNKSGKIDYQEFVIATIDQKKYFNREKLLQLFQQIDRDHSGQLNNVEIKKLLRDMQVPKEKYDLLSKQLDQNGDGEITQEEFLQIMLQLS